MFQKLTLFVFLLFSCIIPVIAQQNNTYTIIDTKSGTEVSFKHMVHKLNQSDIIIFGEEHNDSIAHALQFQLLEDLYYSNEGKVAVSFEMWERDVQPIMNEYLAGYISEKNFKKESRAWGNYDDYKPLVEFAKAKQLTATCANTPARYTNMVTRGTLRALDKLPRQTKNQFLPDLPIDTLAGRYYEKFLEAMGGHISPNMHIYQSQNLWDATMAYSITETMQQDPFQKVLHLNGRFHSDENLGVTYRLKSHNPQGYRLATISCVQANDYDPSLSNLADFVIMTGSKEK